MFVNEDYTSYKYLVDASDNYVILTDQRSVNGSWQSPEEIDVIYQYLKPSFVTLETTQTFSSARYFEQIDVNNNFYSRADCLDIIKVQIMIIFFILFIFNGLTRFVKKGGIFFGQ